MRIALTFDDGPGPSTSALLDVLAARGVRACFFLLGQNIERMPDAAVRVARDGHVLGNHTHSHARPLGISPAQLIAELDRTDALLRETAVRAGVDLPAVIPVRLPYGPTADDPRLAVLASIGRAHVHWTADFEDWLDPDPAELARRMDEHVAAMDASGRDAVLDLHDSSRLGAVREATVEAVRRLLARHEPGEFTIP